MQKDQTSNKLATPTTIGTTLFRMVVRVDGCEKMGVGLADERKFGSVGVTHDDRPDLVFPEA